MSNLLLIDDDEMFSMLLSEAIEELGHEVTTIHALSPGLEAARKDSYDAILLDVRLPDGNGLDLLPYFKEVPSRPEVIIITGEGDPDGAELAIKNGAWDYIEKPSSLSRMLLPITRALEYNEQRKRSLKPVIVNRDRIVGKSFQITKSIEMMVEAAQDDASVLITGPTGTGKEVFAKTLHENSPRSKGAFVVVDCAALPENLVESALFGHKRGAFTGADREQEGLVRQADRGTLFLDEIGEMPMAIQKSFLRVLQEHKFRPLGSTREYHSDFRVIAATNRDLEKMVREGTFREDLLFRLRTHALDLPPLRERTGDIKELALHFIRTFCSELDIEQKGVSPEFLEVLESYPWPGNVRELKNTIEKSVHSARYESLLYTNHLPMELRIWLARNSLDDSRVRSPEQMSEWKDYKSQALSRAEQRYFTALYEAVRGDVPRMAEVAGLTRARIYGLIKKHHIGNSNTPE